MAQGIVLLLESDADARVRACWRLLEQAGIPSLETATHRRHTPHISLMVAERVVIGGWLDDLVAGFFAGPRVSVELGPAAAFGEGGWVYLGVDGFDRAAHRRLVASLGKDAVQPWQHYLPDAWVPHCTLAGGLDGGQVESAIELVSAQVPIPAAIEGAALIDSETGGVQRLIAATALGD